MMTTYTLKMFCLQNRTDIDRVDQVRHVLGHDVVVTFNDESAVHLRFADGSVATRCTQQLSEYTTPKQGIASTPANEGDQGA